MCVTRSKRRIDHHTIAELGGSPFPRYETHIIQVAVCYSTADVNVQCQYQQCCVLSTGATIAEVVNMVVCICVPCLVLESMVISTRFTGE